MCARLLRPARRGAGRAASHRAERARVRRGCCAATTRRLAWALRAPASLDAAAARRRRSRSTSTSTSIVPKGFFPQQDTGRLIGGIQADQGISFQAMRGEARRVHRRSCGDDPAVENVVGFTGGGAGATRGCMFVALKPLAERNESGRPGRSRRLRGKLAKVPGASLFLQPVQDIRIGGRSANAQYQYTLQADDLDELRAWAPRIRRALSAAARARRRQHRPAGQGAADHAGHRPRRRGAARHHRADDRRRRSTTPSASGRSRPSTRRSTSTTW